MRKATAVVLVFVLLLSAATGFAYTSTSAQSASIVIVLQIGSRTMMVNGKAATLDAPPVILEGRTLLPIRAVIEALGGTVVWDAVKQQVTLTLLDTTVTLWIGQQTARVNGEVRAIDPDNSLVVPRIISSRTMLPIRFVAQSLGCTIEWNGTLRTITVALTLTPDTVATKVVESTIGGYVQLGDGAEVTIPKGALSASTTVTISRKTATEAGVTLPTALLAGGVYDISAGTASILGTVTIALPLAPGAQNPALYYLKGNVWVFSGGEVVGNRIVAQTDHFSLWTVLESFTTRIVDDYKPSEYGFAFCNCTEDILKSQLAQQCSKCQNGICAGMVTASYALYRSNRVAPACDKFVSLSEEWQNYTIAMQIANGNPATGEASTNAVTTMIAGGQSVQVSTLWAKLNAGQIIPVELQWLSGLELSEHEILVYGIRRKSLAEWELLTYDPNYPGVETNVEVTVASSLPMPRFSVVCDGHECLMNVDWHVVDAASLPATSNCALPDLQITSVTWAPDPVSQGSATTFSVVAKNAGQARADGFSVALSLDGLQVASGTVSGLDAGAEATVLLTPAWTATSSCRNVQAVVDPDNKIAEENENNNTRDAAKQICPTPAFSVTVLCPNGGETFKVGDTVDVKWTTRGPAWGNVSVFYSFDGCNWSTIMSGGDSSSTSYQWVVPDTPSTECLLFVGYRVPGAEDWADWLASDMADHSFTIQASDAPGGPTILLTSPNGGENWQIGSQQTITWTASGLTGGSFEIDYWDGTDWVAVATGLGLSTRSYTWTIPGPAIDHCGVRVGCLSAGTGVLKDTSDIYFTLSMLGSSLTVVSPNGGENWQIGSQQTITWTASGLIGGSLEIGYWDGTDWISVATGLGLSTRSYTWTIPGPASSNCYVSVGNLYRGRWILLDSSDSFFVVP